MIALRRGPVHTLQIVPHHDEYRFPYGITCCGIRLPPLYLMFYFIAGRDEDVTCPRCEETMMRHVEAQLLVGA